MRTGQFSSQEIADMKQLLRETVPLRCQLTVKLGLMVLLCSLFHTGSRVDN